MLAYHVCFSIGERRKSKDLENFRLENSSSRPRSPFPDWGWLPTHPGSCFWISEIRHIKTWSLTRFSQHPLFQSRAHYRLSPERSIRQSHKSLEGVPQTLPKNARFDTFTAPLMVWADCHALWFSVFIHYLVYVCIYNFYFYLYFTYCIKCLL